MSHLSVMIILYILGPYKIIKPATQRVLLIKYSSPLPKILKLVDKAEPQGKKNLGHDPNMPLWVFSTRTKVHNHIRYGSLTSVQYSFSFWLILVYFEQPALRTYTHVTPSQHMYIKAKKGSMLKFIKQNKLAKAQPI